MATARKRKIPAEGKPTKRRGFDAARHPAMGKLLLAIIRGCHGPALDAAVKRLKIGSADAPAMLEEARRQITLAADYDRNEEVGTAINALAEIYASSMLAEDFGAAIRAAAARPVRWPVRPAAGGRIPS